MYSHDSWDWLWMTLAMGLWLVVVGVVVYFAVRFALGDRDRARRL
jgi:heme/copper-type cytochrome/quinol oxidase subunit 2